MGTVTDTAQLSGLFKEVYGDDVINLLPEAAKFTSRVPFAARNKQEGNFYNQPVVVHGEHGVTYAAPDAGAFSLNPAIAMKTQNAQVKGYQMLLRSAISYDAAAKAAGGGARSFSDATELVVMNMMESIGKRLEIASFYGTTGIGVAASSVNIGATSTTITYDTASWASGIWAGAENATVQFYDTVADTLVSSGADSAFTVTAVDTGARTIVVTGTATGITALDIALAGALKANTFFYGAHGNEMPGLDKIITNSGSLFNVNAATYNLWKGNSYAVGGALTPAKLFSAVSVAVGRGLSEKVTCYLNPQTWSNVMDNLAALRSFDQSYSADRAKSGSSNVTLYSMNGEIELVPHNIVKEGEAFLIPEKRVKRLGAQDVSFKTPGRGEEIFRQLDGQAGFELRLYTDQAVFIETPARTVKLTGIVNA